MEQFSDRVFVHRRRISKAVFNKLHITILKFPFYRKFWEHFVRKSRIPLHALHIHDLPLACVGLRLSRLWGIPLILDFHENYPAALKTWEYAQERLARPFLEYNRWKRYEREMVAQADRIIVVIKEDKERFVRLGFPEEKFSVVANTINTSDFPTINWQKVKQIREQNFIILYEGGFGIYRGLETAIAAMPMILKSIPNAKLILVGEGRNRYHLEQLARVKGINNRVNFTGWVSFKEIPTYIASSDVCLIPLLRMEKTETAMPHKLFHYWYLSKPVIVSNCRSLEQIVQEVSGGLVFQAGNPQDLAEKVICLKDFQLRLEIGKRGRQAILNRYNWSVDSQRLVQLYRELLHGD